MYTLWTCLHYGAAPFRWTLSDVSLVGPRCVSWDRCWDFYSAIHRVVYISQDIRVVACMRSSPLSNRVHQNAVTCIKYAACRRVTQHRTTETQGTNTFVQPPGLMAKERSFKEERYDDSMDSHRPESTGSAESTGPFCNNPDPPPFLSFPSPKPSSTHKNWPPIPYDRPH